MKMEIDVAEFAAQMKAGKGIGGKDGALAPLIKQLTEMALQAEIETHLAQDLERNRKNGTTSKTMKSSSGEFVPQGHFFLSVRATQCSTR